MSTLENTIDRVPERSRPLLRSLHEAVGMVPNLAAAMAESPELLQGFLAVREIYRNGTFTPAEIEVLSLTAAYENGCTWCMAFHTMMARNEGLPDETVSALRAGQAPADEKLRALSNLARAMVRNRGDVSGPVFDGFLAAGYAKAQALEVILGMSFSLLANYAGHLMTPTLDWPLQAHAWQRTDNS
jgi:AhpD family alkylhydroperoxidase